MSARRWLWISGLGLVALIVYSATRTDTAWDGVDVAVVGKYATELGSEPWTPLFDVQGDLQLFVFTVAGLVGGFLMGYFWRGMFGAGPVPGGSSDSPSGEPN